MKSKPTHLFSAVVLASLAVPLAAAVSAPVPAAMALNGADLFGERCASCHSVEAGKRNPLGPNLAGVVGRPAASAQFNYSPALKASKLTWDRETLDKYLASPIMAVRGTRMVVGVRDQKERAAIIDYLASCGK